MALSKNTNQNVVTIHIFPKENSFSAKIVKYFYYNNNKLHSFFISKVKILILISNLFIFLQGKYLLKLLIIIGWQGKFTLAVRA